MMITKSAADSAGGAVVVDREKQGDKSNKIAEQEEIRGLIGLIQ